MTVKPWLSLSVKTRWCFSVDEIVCQEWASGQILPMTASPV
jgi:hypothetical protein